MIVIPLFANFSATIKTSFDLFDFACEMNEKKRIKSNFLRTFHCLHTMERKIFEFRKLIILFKNSLIQQHEAK